MLNTCSRKKMIHVGSSSRFSSISCTYDSPDAPHPTESYLTCDKAAPLYQSSTSCCPLDSHSVFTTAHPVFSYCLTGSSLFSDSFFFQLLPQLSLNRFILVLHSFHCLLSSWYSYINSSSRGLNLSASIQISVPVGDTKSIGCVWGQVGWGSLQFALVL